MSFQNASIKSIGANPDVYHTHLVERGDPTMVVTSSMLRSFGQCPSRWIAGYEAPDSDAKDYGHLLDCLVLTPQDFEKRFAVRPETYKNEKGEVKPWNNNAGVCREWNQAYADEGLEVISADDYEEAKRAVARLRQDVILSDFIDAADKQVWVVGEWHDTPTGLVIPVQALIDLRPREDTEYFEMLGDLKTTRSAALRVWQQWSSSRGYHTQGAFYADLYNAATGEKRKDWCFVVQENFPPYQTARRKLTKEKLSVGRTLYTGLLTRYCKCLKSGDWPDYDDNPKASQGWSPDDVMPWEAEQAFIESPTADPDWLTQPVETGT